MPEGDTLHRAAETLHRALSGRRVTRFESVYAQLATFDRDAPLAGRTVEQVQARGKHLLIRFSGGVTLRTHLRMNGSWHVYRPGERWFRARSRMRVLIETPDFVAVGFDVPVAELLTAPKLERHPELRALGPDLLGETFDLAEATRRFTELPQRSLTDVLLDQRVAAGAGNVYKCEVLFLQKLYPFDPVWVLSAEEVSALLRETRRLMRLNVGPAAPATGARKTVEGDDPSVRTWVYGRGGEPCRRCGTLIQYDRRGVDARGTYFCPTCQVTRVTSRVPS